MFSFDAFDFNLRYKVEIFLLFKGQATVIV